MARRQTLGALLPLLLILLASEGKVDRDLLSLLLLLILLPVLEDVVEE